MAWFDFLRARAPQPSGSKGSDEELFDADFLRRLESLSLSSRRTVSGQRRGERRSHKRGGGVTFADHRPYAAGDDIRFLDVASYERLGKLLIRLYEEDEDQSLCLLVDCSASMGFGDGAKLRLAQRLAAAFGYVGLSGLDRVSVEAFSSAVTRRLPPLRGKRRALALLRFLARLPAEGATDLGASLLPIALRQRRGAKALLFTDLFDPHGFRAGIDVLRFNRLEPVVIQIVDPTESRPVLRGDLDVIDVETEASVELTVTDRALDDFAAGREKTREQARRYCLARGVQFFVARTDRPFESTVLDIFRQGGLGR